jgi:hypothetical protein
MRPWMLSLVSIAAGCFAAEASRPLPPKVHTTFPTARIFATCGVALEYGPLPEALIDDRWRTLSVLERRALRIEVCGARTRAEVAMATTLIGVRLLDEDDVEGGLAALRHAADVWYEPLAHAELGMLYLEGDVVPADPARAWRYLAAARGIADDVATRAEEDGLAREVASRTASALETFDQPAMVRRFDRRTAGPATLRFVEARVDAYREVYVGPRYARRAR